MKRSMMFCMALLFTIGHSFAQSGSTYQTALGLKFYPGALTFKHFLKPEAAIEGQMAFWDYGTQITGLYEFHKDISDVQGLKWYIGPGAHVGFWNNHWRDYYYDYYRTHSYSTAYVGIDGIIGLDYKIRSAPINLSLDWQPGINFGSGPAYYGFYSGSGGLGIRYTFK